MIPLLVFLAVVLLLVLLIMVFRQKEDTRKLKEQVQLLTEKVFGENCDVNAIENRQAHPMAPQAPMNGQASHATSPVPPVPSQVPPVPSQVPASPPPPKAVSANATYHVQPTAKKGFMGDKENWFGRNVLGITASILIFIGLVFLGVLAYQHITETMKIVAMYVISSIILGLGIWLTAKKRNNFTLILLGCGCGSFFISILLTYIYFDKISATVAALLLLVWMAATLYLSKVVSSIHLSIVAHIGMAVSICFAFGLGLTDEKLAALLLFQVAAIVVILLGNIFCCKKTYNLGVLVSLALTLITSFIMWNRFTYCDPFCGPETAAYPFTTALSTALIVGAFVAQFLCSSVLSALLSLSATRLKSGDWQIAVHIVNKVLWITSLITNVFFIALRVARQTLDPSAQQNHSAVLVAVFITLAVLLIHGAVTLILSHTFDFNKKLETVSILLLSGVAITLLIVLWNADMNLGVEITSPQITGLIGISLLLFLASYVAKNKIYSLEANIVLGLDALFMLGSGFKSLTEFGTVFLSIGYLVFYLCIISLQWYLQGPEGKAKYSILVRLIGYFLTELSLVIIFLTSSLGYKTEILLITLTLLNLVLYLIRFDREKETSVIMHWSFVANEFVLLSVAAGFIAFAERDLTSAVLYLILAPLAFVLAFIRTRKVLNSNNNVESLWLGIKLTILVLAVIGGNTEWFEYDYIFSIVCMLSALLCIIAGFIGKAKTLRYYGLALILVSILKLVTYDVTELDTLLRVLAFIGGGIICFIISAIYTYTSKKLAPVQNADAKSEPTEQEQDIK